MRKIFYLLLSSVILIVACEKDDIELTDIKNDKITYHLALKNGNVNIDEEEMMGGGICTNSNYLIGIQIKNKGTNKIVAAGFFRGDFNFSSLSVELDKNVTYNIEATALYKYADIEKIHNSSALESYEYYYPFSKPGNCRRVLDRDASRWTTNPVGFTNLAAKAGDRSDLSIGDRWYYNEDFIPSNSNSIDINLKRVSFALRFYGSGNTKHWGFYISAEESGYSLYQSKPVYGGKTGSTYNIFTFRDVKSAYEKIKNNPNYQFSIKYAHQAKLKQYYFNSGGVWRPYWSHEITEYTEYANWGSWDSNSIHKYPENTVSVKANHCHCRSWDTSFETDIVKYYYIDKGDMRFGRIGGSEKHIYWQENSGYGSQRYKDFTVKLMAYPSNSKFNITTEKLQYIRWNKCESASSDYINIKSINDDERTAVINIKSYPFSKYDYGNNSSKFFLECAIKVEGYYGTRTEYAHLMICKQY